MKTKPTYPADHEPAMRVPEGGSSCASCEYLKDRNKRLCGNPHYIKWNGSNQIPAPIDSFCSDWYEPRKREKHGEF